MAYFKCNQIFLIDKTASGAVASFSDGIGGVPFSDLTAQIVPFQDGAGDPSPQNVRTIHGYTGAHIGYVDFNQKLFALDSDSWESNDATFSDGVCTWTPTAQYSQVLQKNTNEKKVYITKGHTYFFSVEIKNANAQQLNIYTGGAYWLAENVQSSEYKKYTSILTASINSGYWRLIIQSNAASNWGTLSVKNIQIFDITQMFGVLAESITADVFVSLFHKDYYEKTDGGTLVTVNSVNNDTLCPNASVTWQTEAGTVYGGFIDLTTGLLTVTHEYVTIKEQAGLSFSKSSIETADTYYKNISSWVSDLVVSGYTEIVACDKFKPERSNNPNTIFIQDQYLNVRTPVDEYATAADFLTWVQTNGISFVFELATPRTYQLTPTEVLALLGNNNVFSDTGNTEVTYKAKP